MVAPLGNASKRLVLLRVNPDREIHRQRHGLDLVAAIGLLVVEVGQVLERVRLDLARCQSRIRHHVIREFDDLEFDALLGGDRFHRLEDLCMRSGSCRDADDLRLRGGGECCERQKGGETKFLERHFVLS